MSIDLAQERKEEEEELGRRRGGEEGSLSYSSGDADRPVPPLQDSFVKSV